MQAFFVNAPHAGLRILCWKLAEGFGVEDSRGVVLNLPIARVDMAGLAGCSRELVARILTGFERRRLILRENRRLILNTANLKKVGAR